jgi:uridylate kinase
VYDADPKKTKSARLLPEVDYLEVLRRRGVVESARTRSTVASPMDEYDHRALDDILRDLEPLFTWHGSGPLRYGPPL